MKRFTTIALAICLCLAMVAPAAAIEADFSGYYWTRFQANEKLEMRDTNATSSYGYMKFRLKTELKVSDNITLAARFDALDNMRWGTDDTITASNKTTYDPFKPANGRYSTQTTINEKSNIDFDEAYATIKSPIGGFRIGRWYGSPWGTSFADSNDEPGDKIAWIVPIDNWVIALQYKKVEEADEGLDISDGDKDKYYATVTYKGNNWKAGFLGTLYDLKNMPTPGGVALARDYLIPYVSNTANATYGQAYDSAQNQITVLGTVYGAKAAAYIPSMGVAAGGARAASETINMATTAADANVQIWVANPYFKGTFGGLGIETEFVYGTGTFEFDPLDLSNPLVPAAIRGVHQRADQDVEGIGYYLGLNYDFGSFGVNGGYAYFSGDDNPYDNKDECIAFLEKNHDFNKLFILNGYDTGGVRTGLGTYTDPFGQGYSRNIGNLTGGQANELPNFGYKLWYLGGDFDATETLNIGAVVGGSEADKVPTGFDDKHGIEYNLKAVWKPMDNLALTCIYAYLDAGDIFKMGNAAANIENPSVVFGEVKISF